MSIITTYPLIDEVAAEDLLIIADMSILGTPTRTVNVQKLLEGVTGGVTSVGLSAPPAFIVSNSPVTTSGTLTFTGAGTTAQYIDGTGSLQTFPTIPSGGVTQIVAGQNVTISPSGGTGVVTINASGGGGGVSSIGLSTDITAFTILNSPITTAGTLQINKNGGVAGQYLNQDGTWQYGIFKKDANDGIYVSDRTVANYGAIGANSFDASFSTTATGVNGAVGDHSAAFGENNKTTQDWAFVTGQNNTVELSTGEGSSFVFGKDNTTTLSASIIGGYNNNATVTGLPSGIPTGQVILGRSNTMGSAGLGNVIIGQDNSMPSGSGAVIGDSNSITSTANFIFGRNNNASNGTAVGLVGIGNTMNGSGYAFGSSNNITTTGVSASYGSNNQITGEGSYAYGFGLTATQDKSVYIGSSIAHSSSGFKRIIMPSIITMPSYADDTAAAAGGVVVGELYRDGSTIKIRVT